jgi:EAL domain-containing protein (putative c-di-GMP-specific phosphodiesterase class I)
MFIAKNSGRGRYQFFTQPMQLTAQRQMKIAKDMRFALRDQQFHLVYQPIIDFSNNQICKVEALIRWKHPQLGDISPVEFISIAEEVGLISDIGDWVFRTAVNQLENWRNLVNKPLQISINTSPAQYRDDTNRINQWISFLEEQSIEASSISLEITESMLMESNSDIESCLLLIRDSGMEVALDDFGTGYSSLSYLKRMSVDFLKIDRSFVQNLAPDSDDLALCEAIIVMAHRLGIRVVAEGIETAQQRDLLYAAGCDYGQGYFFYRPLSQEQMQGELIGNLAVI